MNKLNSITDFMSETGLYEQQMYGYKDGEYTIQIFVACEYSWFYVLIYDENDDLIGMGTFITDGKQTTYKIKYAKNYRIIERLLMKLIKQKEMDYVCKNKRFWREYRNID